MGTFPSIALYSVIVMAIVTAAASAFVLLGLWLSEESEEDAGH